MVNTVEIGSVHWTFLRIIRISVLVVMKAAGRVDLVRVLLVMTVMRTAGRL